MDTNKQIIQAKATQAFIDGISQGLLRLIEDSEQHLPVAHSALKDEKMGLAHPMGLEAEYLELWRSAYLRSPLPYLNQLDRN